jgi:hypothetical protein
MRRSFRHPRDTKGRVAQADVPIESRVDTASVLPAPVVLAILTVGDRYALQLRDDVPTIASPGRWSLFGRSLNDGGSARIGIRREIFEELGLDVSYWAATLDSPILCVLCAIPRFRGKAHCVRGRRDEGVARACSAGGPDRGGFVSTDCHNRWIRSCRPYSNAITNKRGDDPALRP